MQKLPGKNEQIIGSVKRQRKLPKVPPVLKKYLKPILLALLVVAIIGAGIFIWQRHRQANTEAKTYAVMIAAADNDLRNGRANAAKTQLETYLNKQNPKDGDHLFNIYARLAAISNKIGDNKKSVDYGLKAIKYAKEPTMGNYLLVAEASVKTGDKQTAITYYQKALEVNKQSKAPTAGAQTYAIQATIDSLKADAK